MATIAQKRDSSGYVKAVVRLIRVDARDNLLKVIAKAHPSDLATILEQIEVNDRRELLPLILESHKLGQTLIETVEDLRHEIIQEMEDSMLSRLVKELSSDDAVDLLESLEPERVESILACIPDPSLRKQLQNLLSYPSGTAGSIMQTEFLSLPETETVGNAIAIIRRRFRGRPIFYLYTVDEENRLSGVVPLRQLLLAEEEWSLDHIAHRNVIKVGVEEDQEKVAALVYRYDLLAVPVVDSKNNLMGMITVDDVMDVLEEEVNEDAYKLVGSDVEELMYGNRIFKISRIRMPWLIVSVATGLVTALIIGIFSGTLEKVIILAAFIPVITGMSGNVGTQSSSITVRGIAVGRITPHTLIRTVFREMRVGFILGCISGILVSVIEYFWMSSPVMGLVIFISMLTSMTFAATTGALMPMLFARFGIDPAVASGPLVTTLNDCTAVTIYLSISTLLIRFLV